MALVAPIEYSILKAAVEAKSLESIAAELGTRAENLMRYVESLRSRGLLSVERRKVEVYELTEEGLRYAREGLPELRALKSARCEELCVVEVPDTAEGKIILANLARYGLRPRGQRIEVDRGELERVIRTVEERQRALEQLASGGGAPAEIYAEFLKRKLIKKSVKTEIYIKTVVDLSAVRAAQLKTVLTPEDIRTGAWREIALKPIDLSVEVPPAPSPVPHFFQEFLNYVREVMVGLGFEEVRGPILEYEFWNFDALFQAQDHPAREVHDTFFVKWEGELPEPPPRELMERVAAEHEAGWGYKWSPQKALGLVMRSQTTATTIRALAERGEGQYKVFTIGRVFRPEHIDAKHNVEFHQLDGIVVGPGLTFSHLLGQLEQIAKALGMQEVKFRPAYFPFTSPSVEVYARHEKLGWVEFGGAGIFRPEVTRPLGVERSRVLAWGWGLDRIAMILLGIDDIRDLFTWDLGKLQEYYRRWESFKRGVGARGVKFTL
ncbi:phenylalanine--tRNA ligase subunit alpha [Thermoproteus tenax]|uniref:phenylalanine--tRNA ligase n=1 Tax=Thermoproteus tenax (strain ATCC 35583 / DSM 2078 / JCM 9277 / NBRC 100435 / Kra 1) TaxID=768679 RepID=G4RNI7_THETK|nr:phenylalanine--tRNA ligase subunit alpha [Thermoproteus tenax]CCC81131.1 phenylalanyl-tRNA synthetase alpha chain [Thermoproteus tenax Kra 1]